MPDTETFIEHSGIDKPSEFTNTIGGLISILPYGIYNEKGTAFYLTIAGGAKGWKVYYACSFGGYKRKGYPICKDNYLRIALKQMADFINEHHPNQLNFD